jgi:glycine/D-amino acid oxidase-like deaminating enzyme
VKDYRRYSLWLDDVSADLTPRPALDRNIDADVAIVGGGYTGLWTAYYLKRSDPSVRVALLEKEICGFGASGRNGGWCSALFAGSREKTAKAHGRSAAVALQRAMFETVDEVGKVIEAEGIDADWHKGGTLTFATAPAHVDRVRDLVEYERSWGFGDDDCRWLEPAEARARLGLATVLGAAYTPHCARIHPAKLARGLARVVGDLGVQIFETTPVEAIEQGTARTLGGDVTADIVVRATEAYTGTLPGQHRTLVPVYSLMIATEPLPSVFWDSVGWQGRETFTDARHLLIYSQRTADDRIAFGGRGAPYHYGSRIDDRFEREPAVFESLKQVVSSLFPAADRAQITHRWGGPVAIPRDWYSSVGIDRGARLAWAGGYVGDGVATTNLAGRTLADVILDRKTDLTTLAWVGHHSRRWEPEPLRWIGTNLGLRLADAADRLEARTGRRARMLEGLLGRLTSH